VTNLEFFLEMIEKLVLPPNRMKFLRNIRKILSGLHEYDRLNVFSEHIINLEKIENEEKRKWKRMQERKNREAFRELLRENIEKLSLTHKTKWKIFLNLINDEDRLLNMIAQNGSTPKELFEDQVESLKESYAKNKEDFKRMIKESGIKITPATTFVEFQDKFGGFEDYQKMESRIRNFFYSYFIEKAKSKEKEAQKKVNKSIRRYNRFLKTLKDIKIDSQYKEFEAPITEGSQQFPLLNEENKNKMF